MTAKRLILAALTPPAYFATRTSWLRRAWAHARFSSQIALSLDPSVVILGVPEVHGNGRIFLGANLFLYRDLYFETQENGEIHLGNDVVISRGVHIVAFSRVEVGDGAMIGEYTSIRDANHQFHASDPIRLSGHSAKPIRIGRNVWIGRGVAILAGVSIGDNAVVGANAVVTRDVPAGAVVAGVPARELSAKAGS
jgi:acetyltransferase-like isoleucine patch superfamily enzyme